MVAIVMVEVVSREVRMHLARTVMPVVVVIRVRVHQRRAQGANWDGQGERDGEEPATHCLHSNALLGPLGTRTPDTSTTKNTKIAKVLKAHRLFVVIVVCPVSPYLHRLPATS